MSTHWRNAETFPPVVLSHANIWYRPTGIFCSCALWTSLPSQQQSISSRHGWSVAKSRIQLLMITSAQPIIKTPGRRAEDTRTHIHTHAECVLHTSPDSLTKCRYSRVCLVTHQQFTAAPCTSSGVCCHDRGCSGSTAAGIWTRNKVPQNLQLLPSEEKQRDEKQNLVDSNRILRSRPRYCGYCLTKLCTHTGLQWCSVEINPHLKKRRANICHCVCLSTRWQSYTPA